jgi:hypothetical protein
MSAHSLTLQGTSQVHGDPVWRRYSRRSRCRRQSVQRRPLAYPHVRSVAVLAKNPYSTLEEILRMVHVDVGDRSFVGRGG